MIIVSTQIVLVFCCCHLLFNQDVRGLGLNSSIEPQAITSQNSITRKAGGRKEVEKEIQVDDVLHSMNDNSFTVLKIQFLQQNHIF